MAPAYVSRTWNIGDGSHKTEKNTLYVFISTILSEAGESVILGDQSIPYPATEMKCGIHFCAISLYLIIYIYEDRIFLLLSFIHLSLAAIFLNVREKCSTNN